MTPLAFDSQFLQQGSIPQRCHGESKILHYQGFIGDQIVDGIALAGECFSTRDHQLPQPRLRSGVIIPQLDVRLAGRPLFEVVLRASRVIPRKRGLGARRVPFSVRNPEFIDAGSVSGCRERQGQVVQNAPLIAHRIPTLGLARELRGIGDHAFAQALLEGTVLLSRGFKGFASRLLFCRGWHTPRLITLKPSRRKRNPRFFPENDLGKTIPFVGRKSGDDQFQEALV